MSAGPLVTAVRTYLDHLVVERGLLHFKNIKFAVLDEVDRMFDIGFRDEAGWRDAPLRRIARPAVFVPESMKAEAAEWRAKLEVEHEAGQSYNVQVPIIVKRKLEIDFTATYDYGTNFKESNYAKLGADAHVLTSFGEPMTGLLTWTYNSAKGTEVDFGWDSYMAAGGSMKGLGKSINFEGSKGELPQGTQLTLVDANVDGKAGSKEYHYEVGEGGATSVPLSGDAGFKDSAGNPYQERWLSEILSVSAKQDNDGAWVVCDNEKDATAKAKLDGEWKRLCIEGPVLNAA